jgi:hypothetical protein
MPSFSLDRTELSVIHSLNCSLMPSFSLDRTLRDFVELSVSLNWSLMPSFSLDLLPELSVSLNWSLMPGFSLDRTLRDFVVWLTYT